MSVNETCFALKTQVIRAKYTGYAVRKTCPQNWTEKSVRQKCQDEDYSDLLMNLPVFDEDSLVTYKNVFCARCNGAVNATYWKLQFDCETWFNVSDFDISSSMVLFNHNCSVDKTPKQHQLNYLRRCIPRFQDCHNISYVKNESFCQTDCLRYAFPVCTSHERVRFRNPQCALCNGFKPNDLENECQSSSSGGSPPLTILFDFSSTSTYSVVVEDRKENAVKTTKKELSCSNDEVYDPYLGTCKKTVSTESQTPGRGEDNRTEENRGNSSGLHPNCTFIAFNNTDYVKLSNGSVYLKLHRKLYNNTTYLILDNKLLVCVNFSRNSTRSGSEREFGKRKIVKTLASLQILTSIGCIASMVSLVVLLITYLVFAELRNLPGKIIINLALSLLLYQSIFFSAVKNDNQELCLAIAVLLHFFVLSSFAWMNVMAYDVHRIFTTSGKLTKQRLVYH